MAAQPRALALCTTAIGDLMFCMPAIAALAEKFVVDVLVHEKRAALLENNPHIKKIYEYRNNGFKRAWLALELWRSRYARVAALHVNDDVYKLLPFLRYEAAWNIQGWSLPSLRLKALPREPGMHNIDRPLLVAQACGASMPPVEERRPQIYLTPQETAQAQAWLGPGHGLVVGLVAGGSFQAKCWPLERFARLGRDLEDMGATVLLLGSRAEQGQLAAFEQAGIKRLRAGFNLPLRLLCGIISQLSLLVTNDTGPLHLAHALQTPSLSLFGPTNPAIIAPRDGLHKTISVYGQDQALMEQIAYADVLQLVKELLPN